MLLRASAKALLSSTIRLLASSSAFLRSSSTLCLSSSSKLSLSFPGRNSSLSSWVGWASSSPSAWWFEMAQRKVTCLKNKLTCNDLWPLSWWVDVGVFVLPFPVWLPQRLFSPPAADVWLRPRPASSCSPASPSPSPQTSASVFQEPLVSSL